MKFICGLVGARERALRDASQLLPPLLLARPRQLLYAWSASPVEACAGRSFPLANRATHSFLTNSYVVALGRCTGWWLPLLQYYSPQHSLTR
eukprot:6192538-Pleurochrysis_carterae.AAC.1